MKILVTGGCGFIGANLVRRLLELGNQVRVLDDLSRGDRSHLGDLDVDLQVGSILDPDAVATAVSGVQQVIHLAAYGSVVESMQDPIENFEINVRGTLNMLRAAHEQGVSRFTFASTGGAIMGNTRPPVDEQSLPRPISPYGAGKGSCEMYCSAYAHGLGLPIVILRFANVYGPISAHKKGAVTAFIDALLDDQPIRIFGDGAATRDFLHVSDLCDCILRVQEDDLKPGATYHVASGAETSVVGLARLLCDIAGKPDHPIEHLPERAGEVIHNFASYDRAKAELGFAPRIGLREGLTETFDWFRAQRAR